MTPWRITATALASATLATLTAGTALAQQGAAAIGKHPPISILINSSPWYAGFEKVVGLYEQQTGNKIKLDVTPFGGMLEKARNAVRGSESPYDILNLDTQWTIEFYEGGFLTPLTDIDPGFKLPQEVFTYDQSGYWNQEKRWRTAEGGKLMAYSPNGNVHLFLYRGDLFKEAGLKAPETWDDVLAACGKLHSPPRAYGAVFRGEKGNSIRYDWMPFMLGSGAAITRNPAAGDYTVTINSPEGKKAVDLMIDVAKKCGPPNIAALGQSDAIQLLATGRAVQGMLVAAAWPNFEDPTKSAVVGKLEAVPVPRPASGQHGDAIGNWHFVVPKSVPDDRKKAVIAFSNWFLTQAAQKAYLEGGGIPVRSDVLTADLASNPKYRWVKAYLDSQKFAKQELGYGEGPQVEQVLGLRLNQVLIGEMSSAAALNAAAKEIEEIFKKSGRKTGTLPPLPES
ncbi:MAG TPA: extracellular solute-binding protein [Microvirga sp.]|jgi:multiple sugar transport system substrate-binding protein|nr:extracellular solute-binding protein [Microvirga sp.]